MNSKVKWTEERMVELRALLAQGYSSSLIADRLSALWHEPISRNAVIGVKSRRGMTEPKLPCQPNKKPLISRQPRTQPRVRRQPKSRRVDPAAEHLRQLFEQTPRPPVTVGIPFVDREPSQCAFPIEGEGLEMRCCGARCYEYGGLTGPGLRFTRFSYCWYHCYIAYRWGGPDAKRVCPEGNTDLRSDVRVVQEVSP